MDDVVLFDDDPYNVDLKCLNRKRTREDKESEIISKYDFNQPDDDDIFEWVSEESYSSDLNEDIRESMGLNDRARSFERAFSILIDTNDLEKFLENREVKRRLDNVWSMIRSFNQGGTETKIKKLWMYNWDDKLIVTKGVVQLHSKCIACNLSRDLTHTFSLVNDELGMMGPDCYGFKFKLLMQFNKKLKHLIRIVRYIPVDLEGVWSQEIGPVLENMSEAAVKMKAYYKNKYKI